MYYYYRIIFWWKFKWDILNEIFLNDIIRSSVMNIYRTLYYIMQKINVYNNHRIFFGTFFFLSYMFHVYI